MEENKFFKWVWRLNGLIIFIAAVCLSFLMLSEAYKKFTRKPYQEKIIVSVADDPKGKEKWVLGRPLEVVGTNYIVLPLVSKNKQAEPHSMQVMSKLSNYSYTRAESYSHLANFAKNILFINSLTNNSFWLFEGVDQLILHTATFHNRRLYPLTNNQPRTLALFFEIVTKDSNKDKVLSYKDGHSLAVVNADGSNYQVIIDEFDKIVSKSLVDKDKILIIFQNNGVGYSLQMQLNTFKVLSNSELPKVKI